MLPSAAVRQSLERNFNESVSGVCGTDNYKRTPLSNPPFVYLSFAHIRWRLECAWTADESGKHCSEAPSSLTASSAADDCAAGNGSDEWYARYYAYGGLFVGDLNAEYNEGLVTRVRTDLTHAFVGMLQTAFALR